MSQNKLRAAINLSITAAVVTLLIKSVAYLATNSVGILSDALESIVNVAVAITASLALQYSRRPVDSDHTYGHEKIEFFSSGLEGILIVGSAIAMLWVSMSRIFIPQSPENLGFGLPLILLASLINALVAWCLLRWARRYDSIVLEANGKHLLTDVYTGIGVLLGLTLVWLTQIPIFDPIIAILIAIHIFWVGMGLVWRSFNGLMDHALPRGEQETLRQAIEANLQPGMTYHALRSRSAGTRRFIDFHLLVPGSLTVAEAHAHTEVIESALRQVLPQVEVTVHIEPIEDSKAWADSELLRVEASRKPHPSSAPPSP